MDYTKIDKDKPIGLDDWIKENPDKEEEARECLKDIIVSQKALDVFTVLGMGELFVQFAIEDVNKALAKIEALGFKFKIKEE